MTTPFNTNNNVPSADVKDLYDNARALDAAINSDVELYTDRLGRERKTLFAIQRDLTLVQQAVATFYVADIDEGRSLAAGLPDGATIIVQEDRTRANRIVRYTVGNGLLTDPVLNNEAVEAYLPPYEGAQIAFLSNNGGTVAWSIPTFNQELVNSVVTQVVTAQEKKLVSPVIADFHVANKAFNNARVSEGVFAETLIVKDGDTLEFTVKPSWTSTSAEFQEAIVKLGTLYQAHPGNHNSNTTLKIVDIIDGTGQDGYTGQDFFVGRAWQIAPGKLEAHTTTFVVDVEITNPTPNQFPLEAKIQFDLLCEKDQPNGLEFEGSSFTIKHSRNIDKELSIQSKEYALQVLPTVGVSQGAVSLENNVASFNIIGFNIPEGLEVPVVYTTRDATAKASVHYTAATDTVIITKDAPVATVLVDISEIPSKQVGFFTLQLLSAGTVAFERSIAPAYLGAYDDPSYQKPEANHIPLFTDVIKNEAGQIVRYITDGFDSRFRYNTEGLCHRAARAVIGSTKAEAVWKVTAIDYIRENGTPEINNFSYETILPGSIFEGDDAVTQQQIDANADRIAARQNGDDNDGGNGGGSVGSDATATQVGDDGSDSQVTRISMPEEPGTYYFYFDILEGQTDEVYFRVDKGVLADEPVGQNTGGGIYINFPDKTDYPTSESNDLGTPGDNLSIGVGVTPPVVAGRYRVTVVNTNFQDDRQILFQTIDEVGAGEAGDGSIPEDANATDIGFSGLNPTRVQGGSGSFQYYYFDITPVDPQGSSVEVILTDRGAGGDADLYVNRPSEASYAESTGEADEFSISNGSDESVTIDTPTLGRYRITVRGYSTFDVDLRSQAAIGL